ncbi:MAG: hypothetical protein K6E97_05455 [Treponema sp.]|nr:hypothetical protein [Treponema sp.]
MEIKQFAENNKIKLLLIILAAVFLMLIITLISVSVSKHKKEAPDYSRKKIILTQEQLIPDGPEVQRDYNITRKEKDKWSKEEIEEWFTVPNANDIKSLQTADDNLISQILGVAP